MVAKLDRTHSTVLHTKPNEHWEQHLTNNQTPLSSYEQNKNFI